MNTEGGVHHGMLCSCTFVLTPDGLRAFRYATAGEEWCPPPETPVLSRDILWSAPRDLAFDRCIGVITA